MMSPLGIVLFGAGAAGAIVAGVPLAAAAGVGALAWGAQVLARVPRNADVDRVAPFTLNQPWRDYVLGAQDATRRFDSIVDDMRSGPLKERLAQMAGRLDEGVQESWRIARRGDDIAQAIGRLETERTRTELAELTEQGTARPGGPNSAMEQTIEALRAQIASHDRLAGVASEARDRLRLLDARFDELVARAVEVSVGSGDTDVLGNEVDGLVGELESLRVALDETQHIADTAVRPRPTGTT